jgi:hypothetical protein
VRFEYRDQPLVLGAVLIDALELEPCRAEGPPGGVLERADGRTALAADIDQVFGECAENAVASRVDLADPARAQRRLDYAEALMTADTPPDWA